MSGERQRRSGVVGVVLAAGASRRMGRIKQLLPIDGRPMLQHALDAMASSAVGEILVVLGAHAGDIAGAVTLPRRCRPIVNDAHGAGMSSSLRLALRHADSSGDAVLVSLADQHPQLAEVHDAVLGAFSRTPKVIARAVYRDSDGARVPGHPVVLGREVWREIEAVRGDRGARDVIARDPARVLEVACERQPPADLDTFAAYRRYVRERAIGSD